MAGTAGTTVIALVGATAVGKTRAAIELCDRLGGEIVGADSVQVYRGFDIGSGKPTPEELAGVQHHLIDVIEPTDRIDAARYASLADAAVADVTRRGRLPIVVGGTGLWLRALLRGLVDAPPVDAALRARLETRWHEDAGATLHQELQSLDPKSAGAIHRNDMVRVVRALEYHAQTGQALGEVRRQHALGQPRYRCATLWLQQPREAWEDAIAQRVDSMLNAGWVEEVRQLIKRHGPDLRALGAVGYREVAEHLRDGTELQETQERIVRATRSYGKRQRTWFSSDPCVDLKCQPEAVTESDLLDRLRDHLAGDGPFRVPDLGG